MNDTLLPSLSGGRATRVLAGLAALVLVLSGCGKFFIPQVDTGGTAGGGGGGGGTATTAFLYVGNGIVTNPKIVGFSTPGSTLAVLPQSPYGVLDRPRSLAITPGNKFLYAGGATGLIFVYIINSDGSLTLGNNGAEVANGIVPAAMKVDATGNWLLAADAISPAIVVFQINPETGGLTSAINSPTSLDTGIPSHIALTPDNRITYVSLNTGGVDILSFDGSTGTLAKVGLLSPLPARGAADTGIAVNPAGTYLYVGETGGNGLRVLKIGTNPALTEIPGSPYLTRLGPAAVLVDGTGSNVYVLNSSDKSISGFSVATSGALTELAGSPYATGINPIDMVLDTTKGYLAVVCSGGSPDLQLFNFDATTPGKLNSVAMATTGTDPTTPLAIVATH